jgi:hypothetical protein
MRNVLATPAEGVVRSQMVLLAMLPEAVDEFVEAI